MRNGTVALGSRRSTVCRSVATMVALSAVLCMVPTAANADEITYTYSGVIRVLDVSSPPPGSGGTIPGVDPLGMDGAAVLLVCVIDSTTAPSTSGPNGDGEYAFYSGGSATLAITGSAGGGVDGTYFEVPCSVRVDDFPVGSSYGYDVLSIVTTWDLGLPFPDVFQIPFAAVGEDTFDGIGLQSFEATDVAGFIGVNFSGSSDAFFFDAGTGIAMGLVREVTPMDRIGALYVDVAALPGLNFGQRNFLSKKLATALTYLNRGWPIWASWQLNAFVDRLEWLIGAGWVTPEDGQPLIDEANAIIDEILAP